jgi:hypothetical protein
MENSLPLLQSALDIAQAAIKRLIIQDILKYQHHHRQIYQSHKNCKITYWILFHRYLVNYEQLKALKDKEKAEKNPQGKGGMRDEDEDDGGNDGFNDDINPMSFHTAGDSKNNNKKGDDSSKAADKKKEAEVLFSFQNISELILYYRDEIIYSSLPTDIPLTRYLMKLLSLQMITMVLQEFLINPLTKGISCHPMGGEPGGNDELEGGGEDVLQSFQFHSNLIQAREKFKQLLSTGPTSSSVTTLVPGRGDQSKRRSFQYQELVELPFSLSFFLNDLMTLACMMSTHTMNDKNISFLQGKGMELLHQIIVLFLQTQDPDVISTSTSASEEVTNPGSVENKILTQFLSQILGAIRHSFTLPTYFTPIHSSSQHLLVLLIKNGFQSDKVAIKRLWKCILGYLEEHMSAKEFPAEAAGTKVFRKRMNEMNELFSLHNFLVFYKVLLNYLHLFQESNGGNSSNSELKSLLFNGDAGLSSTSVSSSPPLSAAVVGLLQECFIQTAYSGMVVPFTSLLIQDTLKLLSFPLMKHSFLLSGLPVENEDENDIDEWNPLRGGEIYSYHVNIFGIQDSLIEATFQSVNYLLLSSLTSSSVSAKKNNNKAVVLPEKFLDQVMMLISLYLRHCLMVSSPSSVAVTTVGQRMMKLLPYIPSRLFYGGDNYYSFLNSFPLVLDTLVLLMMQSSSLSSPSSPTKTVVATEEEHWMDCLSHLMQLLTFNQEDENPNSDDTHCLLKFSSVRKKLFYLFYSFLQRYHVGEAPQDTKESQNSVKSLFQWFFQLLKNYSFPQFFLHRHSHDFDYELIDIFSTFRKVLSVMNKNDNVDEDEYYYILLIFQSFYSLQTNSDNQLSISSSVPKQSYLRTLYLLLGATMSVSLPASSSKRKEQILKLFLDFYEKNVLANSGEAAEMIEEEIRFLGLFLWNSFVSVSQAKSSSSSTSSPPLVVLSENRFLTVLDVVLSLLSRAYDRLAVISTTNETKREDEEGKTVDEMSKLNEMKVFLSEIFSAMLLKMEMVCQSSPLLYRMTVQYFCTFFQRQPQQQYQSSLGMRSFAFLIIEMVLPAVLHSILPITNKNNNSKNNNNNNKNTPLVTDHESRLAIHKLIVLVFHAVIQFYNNNSSDVVLVEKSQMMERLLSLVIPVYCQHISCYYPATSTGNNNSENQIYLVVMGKCLMNIVSLVSQEFRSYLMSPDSGIAEEAKQSLQYVMKLSMSS